MSITICSSAHQPLVRDEKFMHQYWRLGHEIIYIGNRRKRKTIYKSEILSSIEYVGIEYPYYSKYVPAGIIIFSIALFLYLLKKMPSCIHARDLDGLIGAYFYKRLINRECILVYDIADTYSARYNIPKIFACLIQFIDDHMMAECDHVFVPQENRIGNFKYKEPKSLYVIPNCPLLEDAPPLMPCEKTGSFKILLSGEMAYRRGIKEIIEAAREVGDIDVLAIAGNCAPGVEEYLRSHINVQLFPRLSQKRVLELASNCHIIGAYYDPSRLINRQAASNKIFDAMASARPILVNAEVETSKQICEDWKIGYRIPYHDRNALCELLDYLKAHREECDEKGLRGYKLFIEKYNWNEVTRFISGLELKGSSNENHIIT